MEVAGGAALSQLLVKDAPLSPSRPIRTDTASTCFCAKLSSLAKNYVGQQFKVIGLPSHWHWHRNTDMIYCRAKLGGRKDGESSLVWWITATWSGMSGSIRYYSKGRYSSHPENSLFCYAETSVLVQNDPNRSLCLPKCWFHIKSHAQKFTITFDSRLQSLKAVSAATWKTGDIYRNFQDAYAALQCEYKWWKQQKLHNFVFPFLVAWSPS